MVKSRMDPIAKCKGQITRAVNAIKSTVEDNDPIYLLLRNQQPITPEQESDIKAAIILLRRKRDLIDEHTDKWRDELDAIDDADDLAKEQEVCDKYFEEKDPLEVMEIADTQALKYESVMESRQGARTTSLSTQGSNSNGTSGSHTSFPPLEPISLPRFNGDRAKWTSFKDQFMALVQARPMEEVYKLLTLKKALSGPPLELIDEIPPTNANYTVAFDLLKERYENANDQKVAVIHQLNKIQPALSASPQVVRKTVDALNRIVMQMENLSIETEMIHLHHRIVEVLPATLVRQMMLTKPDGTPKELIKVADNILNKDEYIEWIQGQTQPGMQPTKTVSSNTRQQSPVGFHPQPKTFKAKTPILNPCAFCGGEHFHAQCPKFKSSESRIQQAKTLSLCLKCLNDKHTTSDCSRTTLCFRCKSHDHHHTLCTETDDRNPNFIKISKTSSKMSSLVVSSTLPVMSPEFSALSSITTSEDSILMAKHVPILSANNKNPHSVFTLIDSGSQVSFIVMDTAKSLGFELVPSNQVVLQGFGGNISKSHPLKATVKISLMNGQFFHATLHVVDRITDQIATIVNVPDTPKELQQFHADKHTEFHEPKILLGIGYISQLNLRDLGKSLSCGLRAYESAIGIILAGNLCRENGIPSQVIPRLSLFVGTPQETARLVESLHSLESLGIKDKEEDCDEMVLEEFRRSVSKVNGRYQVGLPWKRNPALLHNNYYLARGRLESALRKMGTDRRRFEVCDEIMQYQLNNGIIEVVPPEELMESPYTIHYIPHHPVYKEFRDLIKVRIVYDASAKTKNSPSLNECLYRGPVILSGLFGVLIRCRTFRYLITADIEKAFLQVSVQPKDRDVLRFIWIKDPNKPLDSDNIIIFRFCRIPFGVISSPSLLGMALTVLFESVNSPLAKELKDKFYVDNFFLEAESPEEAFQKAEDAVEIFEQGSMRLHEFISNDQTLAAKLPKGYALHSPEQKILGINWNTEKDVLYFKFPNRPTVPITRRKVLETIMSLFDPIGYVAPTVIKGKILFQRFWKQGQKWEEALSEEEAKLWERFIETWKPDVQIALPRLARNPTREAGEKFQLHVFADASKDAYGAVVYLVHLCSQPTSHIIAAKGRVSPQNRLYTIPELELMAVLIATLLAKSVIVEMVLPIEHTTIWTDNEAVVYWVRGEKSTTSVFVKNRLKAIRDSGFHDFRHVPGLLNPADIISRGMSPTDLQGSKLWWHGPDFILDSPEKWPQGTAIDLRDITVQEAAQPSTIVAAVAQQNNETTKWRFARVETNWGRLILIARRVLIVSKAMYKKGTGRDPSFQTDYEAARRWVIIECQQNHPPSQTHRLNLRIREDEFGILRCHGRIDNSTLPTTATRPIFIDRQSPLARLLVMFYHEVNLHGASSTTLIDLRKEYWIPRGRQTVSRIIKKHCLKCRPFNCAPFSQPNFPQLPTTRVQQAVAFKFTGVDLFGPFKVQDEYKKQVKVYGVIFTCMVTRAVHLELIRDQTTKSVIASFQRFIARRGLPEEILSDNGTDFVAAAKVLEDNFKPTEKFKWNHITPLAPWRGGFYERLIALVKNSLKRTIGRKILPLDHFATLVVQIEAIVNNRPLTQPSDSFDESFNIIRPVDFLRPLSGATDVIPPCLYDDPNDPSYTPRPNLRQQLTDTFQYLAGQLDKFWDIWQNDYLTGLRERQRALNQNKSITRTPIIGEAVLVEVSETSRNLWPIGIITDIIYSNDNVARTVKVRRPSGQILTRAINHIYPLEISQELSPNTGVVPVIHVNTAPSSHGRECCEQSSQGTPTNQENL